MAAHHQFPFSRARGEFPVRRILLIGEYRSLLKSSAEVLRKTNSEVSYCTPFAIAEYWTSQFDLIVICHTVAAAEAKSLAADARLRWPGIRVLQIARFDLGTAGIPSHADAATVSGKPGDLLATTMELLGINQPNCQIAI